MAITPLPTPAPDINDPATFPARGTAQAAAFVKLVDEINAAMLTFGPGSPYCTASGTANAIALTSGLNLASLAVGQRVVFQTASPNTGGTTINLDGLGAVACVTVTGAALPNAYIRAGVWTFAWYNGTNWVVDRLIEKGSNANGFYLRIADGTQLCWQYRAISGVSLAAATSTSATWTYPAAFADVTRMTFATQHWSTIGGTVNAARYLRSAADHNNSVTAGIVAAHNDNSSALSASVSVSCHGTWY